VEVESGAPGPGADARAPRVRMWVRVTAREWGSVERLAWETEGGGVAGTHRDQVRQRRVQSLTRLHGGADTGHPTAHFRPPRGDRSRRGVPASVREGRALGTTRARKLGNASVGRGAREAV